jgi:hypothetical protein
MGAGRPVMTPAKLTSALGAALACLAAGCAHAQSSQGQAQPSAQLVLAANDFVAPAPSAVGRTLEWNSKKARWGLKLGVEPRLDRDTQLRDLEPGVFYKLTPRLHIGGGVTLAPDPGEGFETQRFAAPQAPNPRVRLETTFKF